MILNPSRKMRILQRLGNPWGKYPPYFTNSEMAGYCTPQITEDKKTKRFDHSQCWHTLHDPRYLYCDVIHPVKSYAKEVQLTIAFLIVTTPWAIGLINLVLGGN